VVSSLLWRRRVAPAHRLERFDYSSNGGYFVTICTHRRQSLLTGESFDIASGELEALCGRFEGVGLDCRTLMPDHVHAIFTLTDCGAALSAIVQSYKSITARRIRERVVIERVWQRGFYDRIIRNEMELAALREYVQHNRLVHSARAHPG
jgi:putative transposase